MINRDSSGQAVGLSQYQQNANKNKLRVTQVHESVDYE